MNEQDRKDESHETSEAAFGSNAATVASYEAKVQEYIEGTPQEVGGQIKEWMDHSLALLPPGAHVLELGSATGRDAKYIEQQGYHVDRTDVTTAFVELLQREGYDAKVLNAIRDDLGGPYDMIYANAVLLHFTPEEAAQVLQKAHAALNDDGILAFSVKKGEGSEWSQAKLDAPRYFHYWQAEPLRELVEQSGFSIESMVEGATRHANWLRVAARKAAPHS